MDYNRLVEEFSFFHKGRLINRVGLLGFGLSNSTLYHLLRVKYPSLDFVFRIPSGKREPFMEKFYTGNCLFDNLSEDVLFFSPSQKRPNIKTDTVFSSEYELFFEKTGARIFAVSGSDGKSTTATMASLILGDAFLCGNIGSAACQYSERTGDGVIELSSFQLNYFTPKSYSAVLTSLSENHLDFHLNFESYALAKENLLIEATHRAVWQDTEREREIIRKYRPESVISFGKKREFDALNFISIDGTALSLNGEKILDLSPLFVYGEYTVKNFLSAFALTLGNGDPEGAIRKFRPIDERCTLVKSEGGVSFYSSSIDSTPSRTATTLSRFFENVILILGGRDKGLSVEPLIGMLEKRVKAIFFYGECGKDLMEKISSHGVEIPLKYTPDFDSAVRLARATARSGDTVLLSPAATSYDCFKDYLERGRKFREIINEK